MISSLMGKYDALRNHLTAAAEPEWRAGFAEIEAVLGFSLPRSAYAYPAWWSNDATSHSHSRAWLDAGWKTEKLDLPAQRVTFREARDSAGRKRLGPGPGETLYGALRGVIQMVAGTDLTRPTGPVLDRAGSA